jgi:hypothetical protein
MSSLPSVTEEIVSGSHVFVKDLQTRPELNHKLARVLYFDSAALRYGIEIADTGESIRVKRDKIDFFAGVRQPQLFVLLSLFDFWQPRLIKMNEVLPAEAKYYLYNEQCKALVAAGAALGDTILPFSIPLPVFRELRPDSVISPMYFKIDRALKKQIEQEMANCGASYVIVCTEQTDTESYRTSRSLRPGECRIEKWSEADVRCRPVWRLSGESDHSVQLFMKYPPP